LPARGSRPRKTPGHGHPCRRWLRIKQSTGTVSTMLARRSASSNAPGLWHFGIGFHFTSAPTFFALRHKVAQHDFCCLALGSSMSPSDTPRELAAFYQRNRENALRTRADCGVEPLANLPAMYANSSCWWVAVGMGQDMVSFAPITQGRTMHLLFWAVEPRAVPHVPCTLAKEPMCIMLPCTRHRFSALGTFSLEETQVLRQLSSCQHRQIMCGHACKPVVVFPTAQRFILPHKTQAVGAETLVGPMVISTPMQKS